MPFEIVMIVAIAIGGAIFLNHQETKKEVAKAKVKAQAKAEPNTEVLKRLDNITRRLEALEAIVTDEDRELTRKFQQLREDTNRTIA